MEKNNCFLGEIKVLVRERCVLSWVSFERERCVLSWVSFENGSTEKPVLVQSLHYRIVKCKLYFVVSITIP